MTASYAEVESTTGHPYATPDFDSLPQTPVSAPGQSVWSQLANDFRRQCFTASARTEYAQWQERHGWRANTPAELVENLRDDPHGLGAVVAYYQGGSKLAAAILVEAFRPALITFTRYARLDDCEQIDRPEVRAQAVLVVFYDVASTTDPHSLSIAGRLYGETLKRTTRERPIVPQYPASGTYLYEQWDDGGAFQKSPTRGRGCHQEEGRGVGAALANVDIAPVAQHTTIDWEAIERKGLVRELVTNARAAGVISESECELLCDRFLGDSLVPVPTLARSMGESVSYCETKLRRALSKMRVHYGRETSAAVDAVA
ncbi:hypothetical protein MMAG44476_21587 [Mycolicibacterium mageritense DSM 44476 = CIP 104973]|uniref:hypothetical protein n=1 Tax=Mycolicibacterium mageritense TaxID=53462 RepID=UPI001E3A4030|nr:hypothetical protein [Mycolicibacterium mageritense]MCC9185566.1 hypothetical protein [Mycolicibacterium mageritense]